MRIGDADQLHRWMGCSFPLPIITIPKRSGFPYWILGTSLESPTTLLPRPRSSASTAMLAVSIIFDRDGVQALSPHRLGSPHGHVARLRSCSRPSPTPATFIRGHGSARGAIRYLPWGSPYLVGRLYFTDTQSLLPRREGALSSEGFAYIPLCIVEFFYGPFLYERILRLSTLPASAGADRFIGHRPIAAARERQSARHLDGDGDPYRYLALGTEKRPRTSVIGIPILHCCHLLSSQ